MNPSIPTVAKPANVDETVWQRMLAATPAQARHIIRSGAYDAPTSGLCPGFAQANLIVLPREQAYDFLLFAQRNPKPCPLLEVTEVGARETTLCATDCDIAIDFPRYRIYENGNLVEETTDVSAYWRDDRWRSWRINLWSSWWYAICYLYSWIYFFCSLYFTGWKLD